MLPGAVSAAMDEGISLSEVQWFGHVRASGAMGRCATSAECVAARPPCAPARCSSRASCALRLWMQAIYQLISSESNLAALELKRHRGVNALAAWPVQKGLGHYADTLQALSGALLCVASNFHG